MGCFTGIEVPALRITGGVRVRRTHGGWGLRLIVARGRTEC